MGTEERGGVRLVEPKGSCSVVRGRPEPLDVTRLPTPRRARSLLAGLVGYGSCGAEGTRFIPSLRWGPG